jgi:phosphoenolpyruvate phosphomutase
MSNRLMQLMRGTGPALLMEAHDPLSALLAADAGFPAVWASSLSMSTAWGVRDSSELPWNLVMTVLEYMADRVEVPILVDGDSGHGNFNNFRIFCRKLEQLGIEGVCIEDKLFPKTNSFRKEGQPLTPIAEMCGKIRAAKDHLRDGAGFAIVARTEALVSGHPMDEALARARAYAEAGADAILIHSKSRTPGEIFAFCEQWKQGTPLVIVPTTYHSVRVEDFIHTPVKAMICANQNLRASITGMRTVCATINRTHTVGEVEDKIATVSSIFSMLDYAELEKSEALYL